MKGWKGWLCAVGGAFLAYLILGALILNRDLEKMGGIGIGDMQDVHAALAFLGAVVTVFSRGKKWGISMLVLGLGLFFFNDSSFLSALDGLTK